MTKVAAATAAAPTIYQPLEDGGYRFVEGGVWANNPTMIGLVDVLSCFDVPRERIKILSLGSGDDPYTVGRAKIVRGGVLAWRDIIHAALRLQSLKTLGQAGLLIGAGKIIRLDAPASEQKIQMDDWKRACADHRNCFLQYSKQKTEVSRKADIHIESASPPPSLRTLTSILVAEKSR